MSKSAETEPATRWRDWRRKLRPFARQTLGRRGVSSPTALMIIPNSASDESLTAVRPKNQLERRQLEPTVDAEGFEKAMLHLNDSGTVLCGVFGSYRTAAAVSKIEFPYFGSGAF